jgi:hypothetical protein
MRLSLARPCPIDLPPPAPGERVSACDHCREPVHNLVEFTEGEARALFAKPGPAPCVRFVRGADGLVRFARQAVELAAVASLAACMRGKPALVPPESPLVCSPTSFAVEAALAAGTARFSVVDDTGLPIPGVALRLSLPDGTAREVQTDAEGLATVEGLAPGRHVFRAERPGFATVTGAFEVTTEAGVGVRIVPQLDGGEVFVGMVVQTVEVETTSRSTTITRDRLKKLPQ